MRKQGIYRLLETNMLGYADYAGVPLIPLDEPLAPIPMSGSLNSRQIDQDMQPYTGNRVFVRQGVLARLKRAARLLERQGAGLELQVVYGYRALAVQRKLFEQYKAKLAGSYQGEALLAAVHRLIAVPEVAGHPAGAAVDVQLTCAGRPLKFGTGIWQFVSDSYVFSPFIGKEAWENRQLLRRVMMSAGFAPFDGEWWHFSYGDKEWARYYGRANAHYQQIEFSTNKRRPV